MEVSSVEQVWARYPERRTQRKHTSRSCLYYTNVDRNNNIYTELISTYTYVYPKSIRICGRFNTSASRLIHRPAWKRERDQIAKFAQSAFCAGSDLGNCKCPEPHPPTSLVHKTVRIRSKVAVSPPIRSLLRSLGMGPLGLRLQNIKEQFRPRVQLRQIILAV